MKPGPKPNPYSGDTGMVATMRLRLARAEESVVRALGNLEKIKDPAAKKAAELKFNERLDAIRVHYITEKP